MMKLLQLLLVVIILTLTSTVVDAALLRGETTSQKVISNSYPFSSKNSSHNQQQFKLRQLMADMDADGGGGGGMGMNSPTTPAPTEPPQPTTTPTSPPTSPPTVPLPPTLAPTSPPTLPVVAGTFYVNNPSDIISFGPYNPGDTIIMMDDGNWNNAGDVVFTGIGTANNPITLTAQTPGVFKLTGNSRLRFSGSYLVVDGLTFENGSVGQTQQVIEFRTSSSDVCHHCKLTNTAIKEYNPTDSTTDTRWVGLYGTYNTIDSCLFVGKNNQGPLMVVWRSTNDPNYHTIQNNIFQDFASGNGKNGWETIRIGTSSTSLSNSYTTISNNLFYRCNGEIEIISVKSGQNLIDGNTFDSCEGMVTLRHGSSNKVNGNFFFGRGIANTGGVRIIDSDHIVTNNYMEGLRGSSSRAAIVLANGLVDSPLSGYFPVERALVAFNTIYDCKEAIRIGWRSNQNTIPVTDSTIANNAVVSFASSSGASTIIYEEDVPTNLIYEGNLMYGDSGSVPIGVTVSSTTEIDIIDPELVRSDATSLYRPDQSTPSPCIGGALGTYGTVVTHDMDGQSRDDEVGGGVLLDIGADQVFSTDPITSGPLDGSTVGPTWTLVI